MRKMTMLLTFSLLCVAAPGRGEVLWDQSDYDLFGGGFFNSVSGGPPFGVTMFAVSDVTVTGAPWHVETINTFYSVVSPTWGDAISEGHVHVFPKVGPLPIDATDVPTASPLVSMTGTLITGGVCQVQATGLNIDLAPGEYWIGITPIAPSGPFGPEIQMSSHTLIGVDTAVYDLYAFPGPPAWFVFNPGLDQAMSIEGTRPVSVESTSWSRIKATYR
jgi:hypothetical protein